MSHIPRSSNEQGVQSGYWGYVRCPNRCRSCKTNQQFACHWAKEYFFHSRTSFRSLQRWTVGSPMVTKTILTHVVSWRCRFHFRFTFTGLMLPQLHSNPVREVLTVFDQLLSNCIADFIEADGTVWHLFVLHTIANKMHITEFATSSAFPYLVRYHMFRHQ